MRKAVWAISARKISRLMRDDVVEIFVSEPWRDEAGEVIDRLGNSLGQFRANITTPQESVVEAEDGIQRTHYYQVTLDPDVALPDDKKLFIKIIKARQGKVGAVIEVTSLSGGLLGWTINASDEHY